MKRPDSPAAPAQKSIWVKLFALIAENKRQPIVIACALALRPDLLVCDEPVSALDVSMRAQILNLLVVLQARRGMANLFVSHDLAAVRHVYDRAAVMYLGRLVELAARDVLFAEPCHPYTRALLAAVPKPDPMAQRGKRRVPLAGEIPSPQIHRRAAPSTQDALLPPSYAAARYQSGGHLAAAWWPGTTPRRWAEAGLRSRSLRRSATAS